MRRLAILSLVCLFAVGNAGAADGEVVHDATWTTVDLRQGAPADLTDPVGQTRWELEHLIALDNWRRTIRELDHGALAVVDTRDLSTEATVYSENARDWWLPHLAEVRGSRSLDFSESRDRRTDELSIRTRILGSGWVFLPSGPREVRLEQALIQKGKAGSGSFSPDQLVYRWIDPRAGLVAEAWGRPSSDGRSIVDLQGAATIDELMQGGLPLKIYSHEIEGTPGDRLMLGFDRKGVCTVGLNNCSETADCIAGGGDKCTVPVSQVTTVAHATAGDLVAASSWDFTPTQLADSRFEVGSTTVPINSAETCNSDQCGFVGTANMGREDKNFIDPANALITLSAVEGEQRAGDYSIWLRAAVRWEGLSGGLGEGESRTCYGVDDTDPIPEVPLWQFGTQDAGGWYMQDGDSWSHAPFNCVNSVFNHICPNNCGLFCPIWIKGCTAAPNAGTQSSWILKEGPITTPSGHTLNTLLVRQVVDFCAYLGSSCGFEAERVHQVLHLWVAPNLGTVVRLMSEQNEANDTTFTDLQETDIKYGLFPPRSITSTDETDTTISISWDPGTITHHIDGYKVYWDTDSGATTNYAFDSVNNAGQVDVVGTTATISGLAAGIDYFITVTAISDFTSLSSGVMTTYESLLYPRATAGASGPLPPELMATTTSGIPEVTGVTVNKTTGPDVEVCWDAAAGVEGYTILGASDPSAAGNFTPVVADTGLVTCHQFDPAAGYFIVVGTSAGASGPWGHFEQ